MSTKKKSDITMGDLAQAALGGCELGSPQLVLFHSVMKLLLTKLDCENEKVVISGVKADHLKAILMESNVPATIIDEESMTKPMADLKKLDELEMKILKLECQLDEHLSRSKFDPDSNLPCSTECEIAEVEDEELNAIMKNEYFTREVKERISEPWESRLRKLDVDIALLENRLKEYQKKYEKFVEENDFFDNLAEDMVDLFRNSFNNNAELERKMMDIQGLIDTKVDNRDIVEFKEEIRQMFKEAKGDAEGSVDPNTIPRVLIGCMPINIGDEPHPVPPQQKYQDWKIEKLPSCCQLLPADPKPSLINKVKSFNTDKIALCRLPTISLGSVTELQ